MGWRNSGREERLNRPSDCMRARRAVARNAAPPSPPTLAATAAEGSQGHLPPLWSLHLMTALQQPPQRVLVGKRVVATSGTGVALTPRTRRPATPASIQRATGGARELRVKRPSKARRACSLVAGAQSSNAPARRPNLLALNTSCNTPSTMTNSVAASPSAWWNQPPD
jgi:hypothetical protein